LAYLDLSCNVACSELQSIPDDLRNILEQCLAEDASEENLNLYLPDVRQVVTSLLHGLRQKQLIYRKLHRDSGQEATNSGSSRTNGSRREGSHRSTGSRSQVQDGPDGTSGSRRSRRRETPSSNSQTSSGGDFVGGFAPTLAEQPTGQTDDINEAQRSYPNDYFEPQRRHDRSGSSSINQPSGHGTPTSAPQDLLPSHSRGATPAPEEIPQLPPPPSSPPLVPPNVKRYSLVDKPMEEAAPSLTIRPSSPFNDQNGISSPQSDTPVDPPPAVAKSLAALKAQEVLLERRASKRFSTYNISKMTGASISRERSLRSHPSHSNRRSFAATTSNLTPGELAVLTEVDDEEGAAQAEAADWKPSDHIPPMPPLPAAPSRTPEPPSLRDDHSTFTPSKITIFLQLGREVKKVSVEPGISFSALRVLFVDKFSYNPGLENFPAIYIRDPSSQVQYELEDADEVKDKCLLSLNIERKFSVFS